jgi:oligopeptide/dipeptide ABC transporter ATP-binding protein
VSETLLAVEDLRVRFATEDGIVRAVDGVSFELGAGEVLAIVGESGCGKSVTSQTMMGLTRSPNARIEGSVRYRGEELLTADDPTLRGIRGPEISMIFQDPISALNPVYRVGNQIVEAIRAHEEISEHQAKQRATELLGMVGIPDPARRVDEYPHEFSGGMRQRAMIAMALSLEPTILIADEPTTALDVTIQAQIIRLIKRLNEERELAVILVTHDLGVVADIADRLIVMYAGRVVETGTLDQIFYDPQHPYTWGLLGSLTRLDRPRAHRLSQIKGMPPSLLSPPEGCHFRPRCPHAFERCTEIPALEVRGGERGHQDRCWLDPDKKEALRVVEGDIGLEEVPAA